MPSQPHRPVMLLPEGLSSRIGPSANSAGLAQPGSRCRTALALLAGVALLSGACAPTQRVPVSTDPSGAQVFLDGSRVCRATPCAVDMTRDSDHLLTILKDGYGQRDIQVRRVFDTMGVLKQSAREGLSALRRGDDLSGALATSADSADRQERKGQAYVLEPDMVSLRLVPLSGPAPAD